VFRGGFGLFYDRVNESLIKQAFLLNGVNQLSYTVTNPDSFPNAPSLANLSPAQNSIYRLDPNLRSAYMIQSAIGVERQLPRNTTVAVTYTNTRALHMDQTVPINTPLPGTYIPGQPTSGVRPYGLGAGNLFAYESGGMMRQHILMANFNTRFSRNVSLFGNYQFNTPRICAGTRPIRTTSRRIARAFAGRGIASTSWARGRAARHSIQPLCDLQSAPLRRCAGPRHLRQHAGRTPGPPSGVVRQWRIRRSATSARIPFPAAPTSWCRAIT
jgi:hypothetical protein